MPQAVRNINDTLTDSQQTFIATPFDAKVLFAIRADRMSLLDSMKDKLPAILQKRYELKGLTEEQAKEAIQKPASASEAVTSSHHLTTQAFASPPFTYSDAALRVMTQKLSETKVSQRSGIEAFQLQILCEYLEDKIIKGEIPNNRIEPAYFEDKIDEIYEGYYQWLIDKLDPSVRKAAQLLIEEGLIYHNEKTGDSRRESRDSGRLLDKEGITQKLLNDLESNFLLRREVNSLGGVSYEVSHDTLIAPILASKAERNAIEEQERLKIEEAEKEIERLRLAEESEREKKRNEELENALLESKIKTLLLESLEKESQENATNAIKMQLKAERNSIMANYLSVFLFIGILVAIFSYSNSVKSNNELQETLKIVESEKERTKKTLNDLLEAQKSKELTEFNVELGRIKQILNGSGNCPTPEQLQKMKDMKTKYPTDADLQRQIDEISLGNCR